MTFATSLAHLSGSLGWVPYHCSIVQLGSFKGFERYLFCCSGWNLGILLTNPRGLFAVAEIPLMSWFPVSLELYVDGPGLFNKDVLVFDRLLCSRYSKNMALTRIIPHPPPLLPLHKLAEIIL